MKFSIAVKGSTLKIQYRSEKQAISYMPSPYSKLKDTNQMIERMGRMGENSFRKGVLRNSLIGRKAKRKPRRR